MHTINFKQAFMIPLIFLFYGICLPQGKAEKVSITKNSGQVPSNKKEAPITSIIGKEKDIQKIAAENEIPSATSPSTHTNPSPDEEIISPLQEEVSPIDNKLISNEKIIPQKNRENEGTSPPTSELPAKIVQEKEPSTAEGTQTLAGEDEYLRKTPEQGTIEGNASLSSTSEPTSKTEVETSILLNKDIQESHKETPLQKPAGGITEGKGKGKTKPTWKIWHSEPTHSVILAVVITLITAKVGGWMARMIKLPGVVGKLIFGMILGNIYLFTGSNYFDFLKTMPFLKMISYFGTLILLLTAGLHTDLRALLRVGASSFLVCLGGIVAPAVLGIIVSYFFLPDASNGTKLLLAIVLGNTSTGLLFAILNELKAMNTMEGRVIVGATILSEIILILAFGIASGIVVKGGISLVGISISFGIALLFLITAIIIIYKYGEKFGHFLTKKLTHGLNVPIVVILSLLLAFMFGSIGLHTVIGAFIAGLFLRNVKLRDSDDTEHRTVESFIRPFYVILVPILFVRVGALVDLKSFLNLNAIILGLAITGAAVAGKLFCGVCPIEKGIKRLAVGIGMATKLEGTLILTGIGKDIGIFNDMVFSSIIMVIVFTSMVCPFLMKIFLLREKSNHYGDIYIAPGKKELKKVGVN